MANETGMDGGRRMNPWRLAGWSTVAALLLLPLVAMQFTDEVNWTGSDFIVAMVLLGSVGLALELVVRLSTSWPYRGGIAIVVGCLFLLVWINGAVGIIGSERDAANLMFFGVIAVAAFGALAVGFRPRGMAVVAVLAAIAQATVAVVSYTTHWGGVPGPEVAIATGFFVFLWLLAAFLFRLAGRAEA